jgi:Zn-dependent protease/CBS domain-containing protein
LTDYWKIGWLMKQGQKEQVSMFNSSFKLFTIRGIPVGLNISWFLIFALVTFSLSTGLLPNANPDLPAAIIVALGLITSLLFFGSVLAHELGHAWVALREGIPVRRITLFFFGGVAEIGREPGSAGAEFRVAAAGPLVSFLLAGSFGLLALAEAGLPILAAPTRYLAQVNLMLGLFNLIPAFPLDGGRIFRAGIWAWTGNSLRSTRIASRLGQAIAFGMIGVGIFSALTGGVTNGLWFVMLGFFLQNAARSARAQAEMQASLGGVTVGQIMTPTRTIISGNLSLAELVNDGRLGVEQAVFVATDASDDEPIGVLTIDDILRVPRAAWPYTSAAQVMRTIGQVPSVDPETGVLSALQRMEENGQAGLPVVTGSHLAGMVYRDQVVRYLKLRTQMGFSA